MKIGRYSVSYSAWRNSLVIHKQLDIGHPDNPFLCPMHIIVFKFQINPEHMNWYITIQLPKMKALGGAAYPFLFIKDKEDKDTRKHEECHLKDQLTMLIIPWFILYGIFHLIYGYRNNPFERFAKAVEKGAEFKFLGWTEFMKKPTNTKQV